MSTIRKRLEQRWPPSERLLFIMVLAWTTILATFAILRHERLNSSAFDLAIKSQVIWNTSQGHFFASSIEVQHYLGDHVQLIMLLLAPLFWLWADVKILLLIQSLFLALAAIPLYHIAQRRLNNPTLALTIALTYLLYPTIGFVNRFDFHPLTFVILFFLLAIDTIERKKLWQASLWLLLALLCREDVGFTLFAFGLYIAWQYKRPIFGITWATLGLSWSLTAIFVIIPTFRGEASDSLARYSWLGNDLISIAQTVVTRPWFVLQHQFAAPFRQAFVAKLLLPVGYLALLSPITLLITAPVFAYNFLSETPSQSSIYFQYMSPAIPFIFLATIQAIAWLQTHFAWAKKTAVFPLWLSVSLLLAWGLDNPFTTPVTDPYFEVYALESFSDTDAFAEAERLIPRHASLATMMGYASHFALRTELTLFYDRLQLENRSLAIPTADYYLLHLTDLRWGVNARFFYAGIETLIGQRGYEAIYFKNDVVVLTQTDTRQPATGAVLGRVIALQEAGGKYAPTAQRTLNWMGEQWLVEAVSTTAVPTLTPFTNGIQLLGYDITPHHTAAAPLCVTLYWQTTQPITTNYTIFFHLTAADGFVLSQRDSAPAMGFYPTTQWQPNDIIADLHCLQIPAQLTPGTYGINVGLYDPDTGQRLPLLEGGNRVALQPLVIDN